MAGAGGLSSASESLHTAQSANFSSRVRFLCCALRRGKQSLHLSLEFFKIFANCLQLQVP